MRTARNHNAKHLAFIRQLPCIKCADNTGTEAAHIRRSDARVAKPITGIGIKPDDKYTLPLCGRCHRWQHEIGEKAFWGVDDPILWALALYSVTGDINEAGRIIQAALGR